MGGDGTISSPNGISGAGRAIPGSFSTLCLASASPPSTSVVVVGATDLPGTDDTSAVVVTSFVCTATASVDFSVSRAGLAEALPGCSKLRAEDFLHAAR